jgi:outer membrane protein OmpA-like peptidoglycan-associated protein
MASLDELASQIKDRNGFLLEIQGFASAEGKPELNERLSQARSEAVNDIWASIRSPLGWYTGFGTAGQSPITNKGRPRQTAASSRAEWTAIRAGIEGS